METSLTLLFLLLSRSNPWANTAHPSFKIYFKALIRPSYLQTLVWFKAIPLLHQCFISASSWAVQMWVWHQPWLYHFWGVLPKAIHTTFGVWFPKVEHMYSMYVWICIHIHMCMYVYAYVCICTWKIGRLIPHIISHQVYHLPSHSIHHLLWPGYLTKTSKFVSLIPLLSISTTILSTSSLSVLFKCKSHYAKLLFKLLQVLPITVKIASKDLKTVYTNTSWSWSHLLTYFCHSLFSSYPAFLMFH